VVVAGRNRENGNETVEMIQARIWSLLSRAPTNFHTETRNTYFMKVIASTSMRQFLIAAGA
jgi:hypothetical protein